MIALPRPDKRYKRGVIKRDKNGRFRGDPETVVPKRMVIPSTAPVEIQLNPPLVVSEALAVHLKKSGKDRNA